MKANAEFHPKSDLIASWVKVLQSPFPFYLKSSPLGAAKQRGIAQIVLECTPISFITQGLGSKSLPPSTYQLNHAVSDELVNEGCS